MPQTLTLGLVQMTSAANHAANIAAMEAAVADCAAQGATLVALPEVSGLMNRDAATTRAIVTEAADDPFIAASQAAAARHGVWLHMGSTPVLASDGRFSNLSAVIRPDGAIAARYAKIHLFDVDLPDRPPIRESSRFAPGTEAVLVETPWGGWGLSICYDLRFPHLYRAYGQAGAALLFIPSAFTVPTGRAHWDVLVRARAIENGAFVIAAAQVGRHEDGRETWGHSLVVDPWGKTLADLGGDAPGRAVVTLDLARVGEARAQIPSLQNDRAYDFTRIEAAP